MKYLKRCLVWSIALFLFAVLGWYIGEAIHEVMKGPML